MCLNCLCLQCVSACMIPKHREKDAPSTLDKTLLHLDFMPCMQFTLCLTTHILLHLCFAILGSSGSVLIIASASAFVRALTLAETPAMIKS